MIGQPQHLLLVCEGSKSDTDRAQSRNKTGVLLGLNTSCVCWIRPRATGYMPPLGQEDAASNKGGLHLFCRQRHRHMMFKGANHDACEEGPKLM
jgi:hypothetical protein